MSRYRGLIVLTLDILTIFCCNFLMFLPYLMQRNIRPFHLVMHIGMLTVCVLVFQLMFRTYNTLWRYAESREYLTLLAGMSLGGLLYAVLNWALETSGIWNSQALTGTTLAVLVMLGYRFVYRVYRRRVTGMGGGVPRPQGGAPRFGAGPAPRGGFGGGQRARADDAAI